LGVSTDWSTLRGLLIDLDGVVYTGREPIAGAITMPGLKVNKSKFDQKMMLEKERLLVCNAGSFFMMKKKVDKLKQRVNATAEPLKHTFTPGTRPGPAKPVTGWPAVRSASRESVYLLRCEGSQHDCGFVIRRRGRSEAGR